MNVNKNKEEKGLMEQFFEDPWVDPELAKRLEKCAMKTNKFDSFSRSTTISLIGIGSGCILFGFAIGFKKTNPKARNSPENIKYALKAFAYGTGISVVLCSTIVGSLYALDIHKVRIQNYLQLIFF
jgi:hypothetical protein